MRHAPSRMEYSEWTWRWTKGAVSGTAKPLYKGVPTGPFSAAGLVGLGLLVVAVTRVGGDGHAQLLAHFGAEDGAADSHAFPSLLAPPFPQRPLIVGSVRGRRPSSERLFCFA